MSYLSASHLKSWREKNAPSKCPILETETKDTVVDHDHRTGEGRGVISRQSNTLIGKIENIFTTMCKGQPQDLPNVLENIAKYLRRKPTRILHPVGLNQLTSRFKNNLLKDSQVCLLKELGASDSELSSYDNIKGRTKAFRHLLKIYYEQINTTKDSGRTQSSKESEKQIRRVLLQVSRRHTRGS